MEAGGWEEREGYGRGGGWRRGKPRSGLCLMDRDSRARLTPPDIRVSCGAGSLQKEAAGRPGSLSYSRLRDRRRNQVIAQEAL